MVTTSTGPRKLPSSIPGEAVGWPFLPVSKGGNLAFPSLDESVRQSIKIILMTQPGELMMHRTFGAGLEQFVHQPNSLLTRRRIRDAIDISLKRWEPRINLDAVDVSEVEAQPERVRVDIFYRLKRTGAPGTLVLDIVLGS